MHQLIGFSQKSHEEKIIACALCCGYCGLNLCKAAQHIKADPICTSLPGSLYSTVCKMVMDFVISPNLVEQLEQDSVIHLPKREEMNT